MNKLLQTMRIRQGAYERLADQPEDSRFEETNENHAGRKFSIAEYSVFLILGLAMLWAWNMFLAAGPYFQKRFGSNKVLLDNFQPAELSVSTLTNLVSTIILTKLQANASYTGRILLSLAIYVVTFALLSISTKTDDAISARAYFAFLIVMIFSSSLATGFMQNGTLAYASAFGVPKYIQAVMFGQAVAGVLPPFVQIASVLAMNRNGQGQQLSNSAMAYFLTAVLVAIISIVAFFYLSKNHDPYSTERLLHETNPPNFSNDITPNEPSNNARGNEIALHTLAWKLRFPAAAVFITFGVTMIFPVFTQQIISTDPDPPPIMQKASFIPLAFLVWNLGDLFGRTLPLVQRLSLMSHHKVLLALALTRLIWIPLYLSCNIQPPEVETTVGNHVSSVWSDVFYLVLVQFCFGLTNGYIGSCCMMGASICVSEMEKEACGSFMGMMLVAGLAAGSFCSFLITNV